MAEKINPISNAELKLAQILGDDYLAQASESVTGPAAAGGPVEGTKFTGNAFEDVLSKAIDALNGVSRTEVYTNQLIDKYMRGEVEMHEIMIAQSKMSLTIQLAVTTITTAVNTFKEITQMQI